MNTEINNAYKELFTDLENKEKKYSEADDNIVAFSAAGNINSELMVVGRATNGWDVYYNRKKK